MSFEVLLVCGSVLGVLSVISVLSALIEGRRPRVAAFAVLVSGLLIWQAVGKSDDGVTLVDIPNAFVTVAAGLLNQ